MKAQRVSAVVFVYSLKKKKKIFLQTNVFVRPQTMDFLNKKKSEWDLEKAFRQQKCESDWISIGCWLLGPYK